MMHLHCVIDNSEDTNMPIYTVLVGLFLVVSGNVHLKLINTKK